MNEKTYSQLQKQFKYQSIIESIKIATPFIIICLLNIFWLHLSSGKYFTVLLIIILTSIIYPKN